jgi:hypothetical protein
MIFFLFMYAFKQYWNDVISPFDIAWYLSWFNSKVPNLYFSSIMFGSENNNNLQFENIINNEVKCAW